MYVEVGGIVREWVDRHGRSKDLNTCETVLRKAQQLPKARTLYQNTIGTRSEHDGAHVSVEIIPNVSKSYDSLD
jgi:hypothetical protein